MLQKCFKGRVFYIGTTFPEKLGKKVCPSNFQIRQTQCRSKAMGDHKEGGQTLGTNRGASCRTLLQTPLDRSSLPRPYFTEPAYTATFHIDVLLVYLIEICLSCLGVFGIRKSLLSLPESGGIMFVSKLLLTFLKIAVCRLLISNRL